MNSLAGIVASIGNLYAILIIVYVLMSWIPAGGFVDDVRRVLASLVEPYLSLFRRFIPPVGMMDITPIVALLVLQWLIIPLLVNLLGRL